MTGNELRQKYLDFFKSKQHLVQKSYSLIPQNDPTLLIIAAGMAPLKPFFTGKMTPPNPRMATCQKCVRTNDIENVGYTARHQTFFEMLGNFSFGDYFKKEAIAWAWEFVTEHLQLDKERLYASIYEDDDEAFSIWRNDIGLEERRIVRMGKKDNFWEIGPGPCGPCSELYYDRGEEYGCGKADCFVGCDCDRYLEFWNLVFTQFDKQEDDSYLPLAKKNIDTGCGLERLASIMQNKKTNFETDLLFPIIEYVQQISGQKYGRMAKTDVSMKVIADHGRSLTVMISDGIMPSNEGRGYVLRRILRRAVRHGRLLGITKPFLGDIVDVVAGIYAEPYPEIGASRDYIRKIVENEEQRFNETLMQGTELLQRIILAGQQERKNIIDGADVFRLYDTYGFPWELTREIAEEHAMMLDMDGFERSMEEQRERARAARADVTIASEIPDLTAIVTAATQYDPAFENSEVLAVICGSELTDKVSEGESAGLILMRTAFYAEGGGQVSDNGVIVTDNGKFGVEKVHKLPDGTVIHYGKVLTGSLSRGEFAALLPDGNRNKAVARNHTATHILHRVLRQLLGSHVNQAGSLVQPDRLRFDFTHFEQISKEMLLQIEYMVNEYILRSCPVNISKMDIEQARKAGATALFGEKYGDVVRVVRIGDYSMELCGGSHVQLTGEIGLFKVIGEESVAAGVRRIEAVTGIAAVEYVQKREAIIDELAADLKVSADNLSGRIEAMQSKNRELEKALTQMNSQQTLAQLDNILSAIRAVNGTEYLVAEVNVPDAESLRELADAVKAKFENGVILLGAKIADKVNFIAMVRGNAAGKFHAGNIVKEVAKITGGGGGGKPDMAQAGGKQPDKLPEALEKARNIISQKA